jgi:hypothetical protein
MGRVFIIARSEFITAVRARGFLIGIMLMPILFGGAVLLQRVVDRQANGILVTWPSSTTRRAVFAPVRRCRGLESRERDTGARVVDGPTSRWNR